MTPPSASDTDAKTEAAQVYTPAHQQHDGRVMVTASESVAAVTAMRNKMTPEWLQRAVSGNQVRNDYLEALLRDALRAISFRRCGHPPGTVAVHNDGRVARRYWSDNHNRLRWLITRPPHDSGVDVESVDELEPLNFDWKIVHRPDWPTDVPREDEGQVAE